MCSHFSYRVQVDTVYQKVLFNLCLFLFLRHMIQKTKEHIHIHCVLLKKKNSV